MVANTYTAKRKAAFKGPFLRSVSIDNFDYEFDPKLKEYSGIPAEIAGHLMINNSDEFEIVKPRRRKR